MTEEDVGRPVRRGRLGLGFVSIVLVALIPVGSGCTGSSATDPVDSTDIEAGTSTSLHGEPADGLEEFLGASQRALVGPYVASGSVIRTRRVDDGDDLSTVDAYRHARSADKVLYRDGPIVVLEAAGQVRECQWLDDDVFCGAEVPAQTLDERMSQLRSELAADYDVYQRQAGCFELIGRGPVVGGTYGQSAEVCFDDETGAELSRQVFDGRRTVTHVVEEVVTQPTDADFDPTALPPPESADS